MIPEVAFALAGFGGTLVRILATPEDQPILTRKTAGELVLGTALGILVPLVAPIDPTANLIVRSAMVFVVSYAGGDILSSIITRARGQVLTAGPK